MNKIQTVGQIFSSSSEMIPTQRNSASLQRSQETTLATSQGVKKLTEEEKKQLKLQLEKNRKELLESLPENDRKEVERIKELDLVTWMKSFNTDLPAKTENFSDARKFGDCYPKLRYVAVCFTEKGVCDWLHLYLLMLFEKCCLSFADSKARTQAANEAATLLYGHCKNWNTNQVVYLFCAIISGRYGALKVQFNLSQFMEMVQRFDVDRRNKIAELLEAEEAEKKAKAMKEQEKQSAICYAIFDAAAHQELSKSYYDLSGEEQLKLREWVYETNFMGFLTSEKAENEGE